MPLAIDEEKFAKQQTLDMSKPQGTPQGLPVKHIPHAEYPRCVYRHPNEPFHEVLHRNANHEVVHRELVPSEHLVHMCQNKAEFEAKRREGWRVDPYIAQAPPNPTEHLYSSNAKDGE